MPDFVSNMLTTTRRWWGERFGTSNYAPRGLSSLWQKLQQCLFKKVTQHIPDDLWWKDSKEGSPGEGTAVSQEYAAAQIAKVLQRREEFLTARDLPMNHRMNAAERHAFVEAANMDFHRQEEQLVFQRGDLQDPEHVHDKCSRAAHVPGQSLASMGWTGSSSRK